MAAGPADADAGRPVAKNPEAAGRVAEDGGDARSGRPGGGGGRTAGYRDAYAGAAAGGEGGEGVGAERVHAARDDFGHVRRDPADLRRFRRDPPDHLRGDRRKAASPRSTFLIREKVSSKGISALSNVTAFCRPSDSSLPWVFSRRASRSRRAL